METNRREIHRQERRLQEERQAGRAAAEIDEEGNEINPHIPSYIAKAPWYINTGHASLKHQKSTLPERTVDSDAHHKRGLIIDGDRPVTKYRKGACENCGAITHRRKDCLERPRLHGAKWTGQAIQPDEYVKEATLDFEAKRDRWSGYDPQDYHEVIEKQEKIEEERRRLREAELTERLSSAVEGHPSDTQQSSCPVDLAEEERYAEKVDMPGQKVDLKTRMTVRNLRIREDTAKYLLNLDPSSAYYDPKTRSMRGNPRGSDEADEEATPPTAAALFAGDNFVRSSGDASKVPALQVFAWQAAERGALDIHLQANPSQTELAHRQHQNQQQTERLQLDQQLREAYGTGILSNLNPNICEASESFVEYNARTGKVARVIRKDL